ncbi:hypothetical protein AB0L88_14190 [Saccharopolyspora shandongensis]|uniref:DUF1440 domain-containing protein n=1 Tax=Saccharopolyspora shandongensis TaxID=418495 RepID=A0A1H3DB21_9PSEU|nr:hypothetical protein [Saccharopolyspora shandongensis]SDX63702.1 hypothetical protein SAMN05216215_101340 [Saccharopolyspora shandongensis]
MSHSQHSKTRDLVRAGARGLVGAMAMTGIRTLTGNVGLVEETPPEAIVGKHAPESVQQLPVESRTALTEAAHWSYGAVAGLGYNVLPRKIRSLPWSGPAYGLIIWLAFEAVIAPLLAVRPTRRRLLGRLVIALDHAVYGIVVAGRLAPDPDAVKRPADERGTATS